MLSTFPAMSTSDAFFGNLFPSFEGGFTPWDKPEPPFVFSEQEPVFSPKMVEEPVFSNTGSPRANPRPVTPNSGSNEPSPTQTQIYCSSGSDEPNPNRDGSNPAPVDERKRRRMKSNRESAKRSRLRKQKHLENLSRMVNRLRIGNWEAMNRLRLVTHHYRMVRMENDRLRAESVMLQQKLWDMHQVLHVRQLQQFISSAWPSN